jgi:hypothetical protein
MGQVVSLLEKLETWRVLYVQSGGDFEVKASSHGRLSFSVKGSTTILGVIDSVSVTDAMKENFEKV